MNQPTFGDELRRLREERGLSLKKFAQLVHYDPGYLSKIENGLKPPTGTLAKACDEALNTGGILSTLVPAAATSESLRTIHKGTHPTEELWSWQRVATVPTHLPSAIDDTQRAITAEAAGELLAVAAHYRRSYRAMPAAALLEASHAHLSLILALHPAWQPPAVRRLLLRSLGESAVLTAVLLFADLARCSDALPYLTLAQDAARENGDPDLTAALLAGRAFLTSFSGGSPAAATDFAEAAVNVSIDDGASPTTRGWVAAVSSEQLAVLGEERQSRTRLDAARDAVAGGEPDPAFAGVGTFDLAKATAYEGGNLMRLGRYDDAVAVLGTALAALAPTMHRHRCTALIDRAEAHLANDQIDASCDDAAAALSIATHTGHTLSAQRIHRLAAAALPTKAAAARRLWAEVLATSSLGQPLPPC
jgi:transcriptional regulator with XRE-family HTH domain